MELFTSDSVQGSSVNFPAQWHPSLYSVPARPASDPFDLPGVLYPDNVSLEPVQGLTVSQQSRLRGPQEQVDVRSLLATLARQQQQQQQLVVQSQRGPPYPVAGNSWNLDTQPAAVQVNAEATCSLPMHVRLLGKNSVHRGDSHVMHVSMHPHSCTACCSWPLLQCSRQAAPSKIPSPHCRGLLKQRTPRRAGVEGQQRAPAQRTQPGRPATGSGAIRSTSVPRFACMWPTRRATFLAHRQDVWAGPGDLRPVDSHPAFCGLTA